METLREGVDGLRRSRDALFQAPPIEWMEWGPTRLRTILVPATRRSAQILGTIRLEPSNGDLGGSNYLARAKIDPPAPLDPMPGAGA